MDCSAPSNPEMSTPAQYTRVPATVIATGVPFELMMVLLAPPNGVFCTALFSVVQNAAAPSVVRLTTSALAVATD